LRFENAENCFFKSQASGCFFENAQFKRLTYDFKCQTVILPNA